MNIKKISKGLNKILNESKKINEDLEELDDNMRSVLEEYDEKVIALALYLDIDLKPDYDSYVDEDDSEEEQEEQRQEAISEVTDELDSITDEGYDLYSYGSEEYNVFTDSEADDRWEEELDRYIDEIILPDIPDYLQKYFDEESWKDDARYDGRGHAIARYDGDEGEIKYNGTWYYIYRQN